MADLTTSSTSNPGAPSGKWPADAVPESWVNALFAKMHRMWGNTLIDKWPANDLPGVKIEWGKGLRKLSNGELKAGVDGLMTLKFPPSLPEFYAMCKSRRLVEMAAAGPRIEDQTKADPSVVEANLLRMREILKPLTYPKVPTAEWAFKLLMRRESASGKPLTAEVIRCATDAITSSAGRRVVEECIDPELRAEYTTLREGVIEHYRTRGIPLWETP